MSKTVFIDKVFAFGGRRISKDANTFTLTPMRDSVDSSCFEDRANRFLKGAMTSEMGWSGGASGEAETALLKNLAADGVFEPFTLFAGTGALGTQAYMQLAGIYGLAFPEGSKNELAKFTATVKSEGPFYWGSALYNSVKDGNIDASGAKPGLNVGSVSIGQTLVVTLHSVDPPGPAGTTPTLDTDLESDVDNTFASPVVQHSFTQFDDTPGGQIFVLTPKTAPEEITDTWFRPNFTIGGTGGPEFTVLMGIGIIPAV